MSSDSLKDKKVLVTLKLPNKAFELLKKKGLRVEGSTKEGSLGQEELLKKVQGVDGLICCLKNKIDEQLLNMAGPNLKVISTISVGFEHIDLEECKRRGVRVGFTPEVLSEATAEMGVALLLAVSRRVVEGIEIIKSEKWCDWTVEWMNGKGLRSSTVGVVGFGRIGKMMEKYLRPFGVKRFIYSGRNQNLNKKNEVVKKKPEVDLMEKWVFPETEEAPPAEEVPFDELLSESDFVIITCSLNESTKNLFKKETFKRMKKSSILINISRGPVVNQQDLIWALENKEIWGAGLDVMTPEPLPVSSPLLSFPHVVISPHIGSATEETRGHMALLAVWNLIQGLTNNPMPEELV